LSSPSSAEVHGSAVAGAAVVSPFGRTSIRGARTAPARCSPALARWTARCAMGRAMNSMDGSRDLGRSLDNPCKYIPLSPTATSAGRVSLDASRALRSDRAEITCNERRAMVPTIPAGELEGTLQTDVFLPRFCGGHLPTLRQSQRVPRFQQDRRLHCDHCGESVMSPTALWSYASVCGDLNSLNSPQQRSHEASLRILVCSVTGQVHHCFPRRAPRTDPRL
jgi:hypothetical protein